MTTQFHLDFDRKLPPSAELGMAQADARAANEKSGSTVGCDARYSNRRGYARIPELPSDDVLAYLESTASSAYRHAR